METSALVATIDLVLKTDKELAKTIFEHSMTENCLFIFQFNRKKRKCQKFEKFQEMQFKGVDYSKCIAIADMGLLWR